MSGLRVGKIGNSVIRPITESGTNRFMKLNGVSSIERTLSGMCSGDTLISANECFSGRLSCPRKQHQTMELVAPQLLGQPKVVGDFANRPSARTRRKVQLRLRQRREVGECLPARGLETVQAVAHRSVHSISTHGCFLTINCRIGVVITVVTIAMITGIVNSAFRPDSP